MFRLSRRLTVLTGLLALTMPHRVWADGVPSPESHLGFRPGADFHLADWRTVADYFRRVDRASDRVEVRELGTTTEGRPYLVAVVSAPGTLSKYQDFQRLQQRLADPRVAPAPGEPDDPVAASKTVVLITCSIHSTETASTFMAMELLHELATKDDPATLEILDKTILLLVPSANPDGVDKVAQWYERSKGHPWEGTGMPELYHVYAGHDTNRDWFMLNLKETRLLTRLLYREWRPTLLYDVHQMSSRGPRLFVPPFYDPVNPNIDPRVQQSILTIGAHMASDLADGHKRGVVFSAIYDNWWNGGNRTTPQRHNMVAVLTEAASVKLASPIFLEKSELRGGMRGFADHRQAVNFADPWPGGWWRLRDIVDYELICARSLLTLAARYRTQFQANLRAMARDAIDRGRREPPSAWVVPFDQRDPGTAVTMIRALHGTGIDVRRAKTGFTADGRAFPAGSWLLPAAQPYRAHLKDMMERQEYPTRLGPRGEAESPYDVAGWTLPLQMGVEAVAVSQPVTVESELLTEPPHPRGRLDEHANDHFIVRDNQNDDFILLNELFAAEVPVFCAPGAEPVRFSGVAGGVGPGAFWVAANAKTRGVFQKQIADASTHVHATSAANLPPKAQWSRFARARIAIYQPWVPSMDEGWTRLVLERFHFPYAVLHNQEIRVGNLGNRCDVLILPSVNTAALKEGYAAGETDPAYVGGLAREGAAALRQFVEQGGTLVCFDQSCEYAIDALELPVKNVLNGLKTSEFFCPGSILATEFADDDPGSNGALRQNPVLFGVPRQLSVSFDRSLAFELKQGARGVSTLLRYSQSPLESGWLLGPEKIRGKAALVEARVGSGRALLFGFRPQNRGQTHGTFRLLFNAFRRVTN